MSKIKLFFLKYKNTKLGFTLLETLVAISIFTLSVLALLVILSQGISDTNFAKNKIVATYLAQSGVERMRNTRDNYMLYDATDAQAGWESFTQGVDDWCEPNGCYMNEELDFVACDPDPEGCLPMLYDSETGVYGYSLGVDSGFVMKITIETVSVNELKINSTVTWNVGSNTQQVEFTDNLFNWIEQ